MPDEKRRITKHNNLVIHDPLRLFWVLFDQSLWTNLDRVFSMQVLCIILIILT